MIKHHYKRFLFYIVLSFFLSLLTIFYELNTINNPILILEGLIYFSIVIFLNDIIIRWFYLKTNLHSSIKIIINILIGLSLLIFGRFLISSFSLYKILTFDLFIVILFPLLLIVDVNLDFYIRKSFEKYNLSLRNFRNKKNEKN